MFLLFRNTLELLSRPEQGERSTDGLEDQEGVALEDGGAMSGVSLAHLRRGQSYCSSLTANDPYFICLASV